jgi:hypothetical protein
MEAARYARTTAFSDPIVGVARLASSKTPPLDAPKPDVVITIKKCLTYEVRVQD